MKESDPCGYCGCMRKYHNPPKFYFHWRDRAGVIEVKAPTCCDSCPHCICSCVAFIEPFEGQKRTHCAHATENNIDHDYHTEWDSFFDSTPSRNVPQVQPKVQFDRRDAKISSMRKGVSKKGRKDHREGRGTLGIFKHHDE